MSGKRILIVEDSPAIGQTVRDKLSKEGYHVYLAQNGFEALRDLDEVMPDLMISDINMPKLDGLKLCQAIQNRAETKDIPFIFLSSQTDEKSVQKAADIGASHFFAKPFDINAIIAKIKEIIG